jgi:hypothetical protein
VGQAVGEGDLAAPSSITGGDMRRIPLRYLNRGSPFSFAQRYRQHEALAAVSEVAPPLSDSLSLSLNTSDIVQTAGGPSDTDPDDDNEDDNEDDPDSPGYDEEEPASDALMHSSICRGGKLQIACTQNADKAANYIAPVYSLWDGSMYTDFTTWGYKDGA